jgi:hypothetical protein
MHVPPKEGYLIKKSPGMLKRWQRRWFVLDGGVLAYYKTHDLHQPRDHTSSPERECTLKVSHASVTCVNVARGCAPANHPGPPLPQVNLQATPAVAVTTQSQPAEVPEGALQDWQQLSDFDILVIWGESQEETLLLRAASIEERDTWVALIQEASGRGPPVARDEDAALVVALNQLHATEASARTPFLASSTINLDEVYELQHVLGQGAVKGVMVRLGRHRASGEVVAIKQVPKTSLATPRQQETMKREVDIMMAVSNTAPPDIALVRAYAVIETSTMVYIVMVTQPPTRPRPLHAWLPSPRIALPVVTSLIHVRYECLLRTGVFRGRRAIRPYCRRCLRRN